MLRIEVLLACSHHHCIPVSAYAHAHVSIMRARSDASLGIGRLTIDSSNKRAVTPFWWPVVAPERCRGLKLINCITNKVEPAVIFVLFNEKHDFEV